MSQGNWGGGGPPPGGGGYGPPGGAPPGGGYGPPPGGGYGPPPPPPPKKGLSTIAIVAIVLGVMVMGPCALCVCVGAIGSANRENARAKREKDAPLEEPADTAAARAAPPTQRPQRSTPVAKTYEKVDRATMQAEYKNNEVRADAIYKDHFVEISGVAGKIDKGPFGGVYISVGSGARFDMEAVRCTVNEDDKAQIAAIMTVNKGDKVTVHGRVQGFHVMSVSLQECALVK